MCTVLLQANCIREKVFLRAEVCVFQSKTSTGHLIPSPALESQSTCTFDIETIHWENLLEKDELLHSHEGL